MDRAKAAIHKFVGKEHEHNTDVEEIQAKPVVQEVVQPQKKVVEQEVVKQVVHQDHYHTTIQPIKDRQVLPEEVIQEMTPVQRKEYEHDNAAEVEARLRKESEKFKDTSVTETEKLTHVVAPEVTGEHVHHHVHEIIQPVIQREVVAPKVIHKIIPVEEVHHATEVHGTSILPVKTMAEFQGDLTGSQGIINKDRYDGDPRPYNPDMQLERTEADVKPHTHIPGIGHHHEHHHGTDTAGPHRSDLLNKTDPRVDSDRDGRGIGSGLTSPTSHSSRTTAGPHSSNTANKVDPRVDSDRDGSHTSPTTTGNYRGIGTHTSPTTTGPHHSDVGNKVDPRVDSDRSGDHHAGTHKKPGLLDRLNPLKDSDHDGKKGFME